MRSMVQVGRLWVGGWVGGCLLLGCGWMSGGACCRGAGRWGAGVPLWCSVLRWAWVGGGRQQAKVEQLHTVRVGRQAHLWPQRRCSLVWPDSGRRCPAESPGRRPRRCTTPRAHTGPPTGALQHDLRRAVEEKVLALDLLASAERRLVEQEADSGVRRRPGLCRFDHAGQGSAAAAPPCSLFAKPLVAILLACGLVAPMMLTSLVPPGLAPADASSPLHVHQLLLSGRRLSGLANSSGHSTPGSQRHAQMLPACPPALCFVPSSSQPVVHPCIFPATSSI